MDDVDRAQAREQELREDALNDVRRKAHGGGAGAVECRGCGCRIPAARRRAVPGVELCVDCQAYNEWRESR